MNKIKNPKYRVGDVILIDCNSENLRGIFEESEYVQSTIQYAEYENNTWFYYVTADNVVTDVNIVKKL